MTPQELEIANQRAMGVSIGQIGTDHGIPKSTAQYQLSKPELKAYIERVQADLIQSSLEIAKANYKYAIKKYQDQDTDVQLRDHGFKASKELLQATNILPSATTSIMIQQIYNDNRNEVPDVVKELFARVTHSTSKSLVVEEKEAIDV